VRAPLLIFCRDEICAKGDDARKILKCQGSRSHLLAGCSAAAGNCFGLGAFALFPVVEFIAVLQQRVMSLGAWAAICYPLLFCGL